MKTVFKILNRYNKNYLYKQGDNKRSMNYYQKEFSPQGLYEKIENDFDYIDFTIKRTSFENMRSIQREFFNIKESLRELWDVISYQEKHLLVYNKLTPFLDTLKSFECDGKRNYISFFDELINAYYDHDMLMFENTAYHKYLYDYTKIVTLDNLYGIEPIRSGFAQVDFIMGESDHYVMYNMEMKRFYINNNGVQTTVGLQNELSEEQIVECAKLLKSEDVLSFIAYIIEHDLIDKRAYKKLSKIEMKLKEKLVE